MTATLVGLGALTPPQGGAVVTIGTFDGVHLGHRALIARIIGHAGRLGGAATVVTWDRHPAQTLRPGSAPTRICSQERKVELLAGTGIDVLVVLPFDEELSSWPPQRFVNEVLVSGLGARFVTVGDGWRFGNKAAGDVALLEELGTAHGFGAEAAPLLEVAGARVSSTKVRQLITAGSMEGVTELLERPFDLDGMVVRGDRRGTKLGYPTANVDMDPGLAAPPRGVYAGRTRALGAWHAAAINVGVNPTFGGDPERMKPKVEAYLLDFDADIYDEIVRVELWHRLRDEDKFDSVAALVHQMALDVEATRRLTC